MRTDVRESKAVEVADVDTVKDDTALVLTLADPEAVAEGDGVKDDTADMDARGVNDTLGDWVTEGVAEAKVLTDTDRDVRGETDGEELCDGEFEAEVERLETRDADRAPDAVAHEGEEDADGDRLMEGEPEDVEETDVEGESVGDTDDVLDCVMIDADADAVE